jgi:hypothetical protein
MAGGLLELVAHGVQDIYLIGNPEITFFKVVFKRHTNFSMESIQATFDGDINFGNKITAKIPRNGDLAYTMVLEVDLPAITALTGTDPDFSISYVNALGHAIIDYAEIKIGGNSIDKQYGEWMEIWSQLTLDESKKFAYQDMLSRYDSFTKVNSATTVYIPLQFWFCRNIGLALPLVALQYHEVEIDIKFKPLEKLFTFRSTDKYPYYYGSKSGTTVTLSSPVATQYTEFVAADNANGRTIVWAADGSTDTINGYSSATEVSVASAGTKSLQEFYIKPNDTISQNYRISDARLFIDYIFLDTYERKKFAQMKHRYLIEQVQFNGSESYTANQTNKKFSLDFNLPVKSLYWMSKTDINVRENDHFNFSDTGNYEATKTDPVSKAVLLLNGTERFAERNGKYFRLIQPFQKHTRVPNDFIYMYSFALKPENHQPSGSCNFSKIDNASLSITFKDSLSAGSLRVYALNYNILRVFAGMGGLAFSN